jgi:primase-polymerase (primpol)-like protein
VRITIVPVRVDAIPAQMAAERRWVCWRLAMRRGKPTKVPVNPHTGGKASSTQPTSWGAIDDALTCMRRNNLPGIGFMLGDGWAGVDQDHCLDPATGTLEGSAGENVCLLDSYTEVSPRGDGVRRARSWRLPHPSPSRARRA